MSPVAAIRRFGFDAVVVALAIWGVVDAAVNPLTTRGLDMGPDWIVISVIPLIAAPLLVRRAYPFFAPVASLVIAAGSSFAASEAIVDSPSAFFLLVLVAYSLGMLPNPREAFIGLGLTLGCLLIGDLNQEQAQLSDYLLPGVFFSLAWLVGFYSRRREEGTNDALERARLLEADRERAAHAAVAAERQRIARELHDVIAHSVSVMTVQAGAVRRLLDPQQQRERQALETVEATGRQALTEMRRLVGLLREQGAMPEFAPQPSMQTIDTLVGTVREAGLPVELSVEGEPRELPPGVDLSAYRVVQEALTNALKYAGPAHAWVTVRWRADELELEIANDGRSEETGNGGGHGLAGMSERVSVYGGSLETGTRQGGGFVVRAHLPLESV